MSNLSNLNTDLPPEQQAIRARCFHPSKAFVEFKKEDVEQSVPERFEKIVAKYPDRIAVRSKDRSLTYDALDRVANRIAHVILDKHGEGNQPAAILMEHGVAVLVTILAALKAGKMYVPLNPSYPLERLRFIQQDAQPALMLTNHRNLALASSVAAQQSQVINTDEVKTDVAISSVNLRLPPETLAYILYTSGSAGQPKGVVQNHRNALHNIMTYTNTVHICANDRLTLLHSCSFSGSVYNLFGALLNGAALLPFDLKGEGVNPLGNWLAQEEISICHSFPTAFCHAAQALTGGKQFPNLRVIHLSGTPVSIGDVELYRKHFSPECIFVHRMGTTETGTIRWYFIDKATPIDGTRVPIGYPVDHKEVLLLDESGGDVGHNCIGEIGVKSRYLSLGYWRKPQLTRAKFLPDPKGGDQRIYLTGDLGRMAADGCLFHLGRKDFRVKVRGYTVEVGEIEMALLEHAGIKEAAVVGREIQSGDRRLVAYFVPTEQRAATVTELRNCLKDRLPDYMIPSAFVMLRALPLTPNGKVDRLALPDPEGTRPELDTPFAAPRTPIEKELAKVWAEILSLNEIGIHDNFFDLGGHSLAATRVVSQVFKTFQLDLPLQSLFQSPTVAEMAAVITEHRAKKLGKGELDRILAGLELLSDEVVQGLLADERNPLIPGDRHE